MINAVGQCFIIDRGAGVCFAHNLSSPATTPRGGDGNGRSRYTNRPRHPISPRTHPRWRNTGRALAPPLLFANLLYKPPAPCPAEGSGCQTGSISAMVKDRPRAIAPSKLSLQPAPSAPNPAHIPHAVTPGGAVLHPVGANPQPAAPLARCQPAL